MASTLTDDRSFVFTDIELSSAHWRRDETAMSRVMPLHNELIETAFLRWNGTILRGEGDSCACIFVSPVEALEASGDIQRELAAAVWEVELRVRSASTPGACTSLDGTEYGGTPLNYFGRLHKAGHGGQILVSDHTASLLRNQLPDRWELVDLGDFVLKDFPRRQIFQAAHPDLPRDFPPLNALRPIHGRSMPDNAFVGRAPEVAAVGSLLRSGCTTVTGPAGIGKTRLACEIALKVRDAYRDGVCIVELAGVRTEEQVAAAIASALQIDPQLEPTVERSILRSLDSQSMLVILDNCEHVSDAVGPLAVSLCTVAGIHVLATSRTPLGVRGERVYPLQPLPHPGSDTTLERAVATDADPALRRPSQGGSSRVHSRSGLGQAGGRDLSLCRRHPPEHRAGGGRGAGRSRWHAPGRRVEGQRCRPDHDRGRAPDARARHRVVDRLARRRRAGAPHNACGVPGRRLGRARRRGAPRRRLEPPPSPRPRSTRLSQRSLVQFEDSAAGGHFRLLEPMRLTALQRIGAPDRAGRSKTRHAEVDQRTGPRRRGAAPVRRRSRCRGRPRQAVRQPPRQYPPRHRAGPRSSRPRAACDPRVLLPSDAVRDVHVDRDAAATLRPVTGDAATLSRDLGSGRLQSRGPRVGAQPVPAKRRLGTRRADGAPRVRRGSG